MVFILILLLTSPIFLSHPSEDLLSYIKSMIGIVGEV